jgi:hypothetical protein
MSETGSFSAALYKVSLPALIFKATDVFMRENLDISRVLQFFYVFYSRFINGRGRTFWTCGGHGYD